MSLPLRVAAAQATFDAFHGKAFQYGKYDCVKLAAHTLKGLGYQPRLNRGGVYTNEIGAARALRRAGFKDTVDWMDDIRGVTRLAAPAFALPGDILGFRHPSQGALTGLSVFIGNGRILAFLEDQTCHAVEPTFGVEDGEYFAWSCPPRKGSR